MIDLEKLREQAQDANTAEQWYEAHDMTSCSYDYDKAFIAACSPSVVIELLDHIEQLKKDAGIGKVARKAISELEDSPISFMKTIRRSIDTAIEAKHG